MDNHKKVNNEADIQANIHAERHAEIAGRFSRRAGEASPVFS